MLVTISCSRERFCCTEPWSVKIMKALGWPVACDGFGSAVRGNPKLEFPHQPGIQIRLQQIWTSLWLTEWLMEKGNGPLRFRDVFSREVSQQQLQCCRFEHHSQINARLKQLMNSFNCHGKDDTRGLSPVRRWGHLGLKRPLLIRNFLITRPGLPSCPHWQGSDSTAAACEQQARRGLLHGLDCNDI